MNWVTTSNEDSRNGRLSTLATAKRAAGKFNRASRNERLHQIDANKIYCRTYPISPNRVGGERGRIRPPKSAALAWSFSTNSMHRRLSGCSHRPPSGWAGADRSGG